MKRLTYLLSIFIVLFGCSNPSDGTPENGSGNGGSQDDPNGVLLVFPEESSLCNEGTEPTPTQSTVFFEWEPNDNAQSYTLTVENLATGAISQFDTEDFIFPVTIERAQAFRWSVNYEAQGETKESEVWNFYNAGPGVQTYPPFPAEIIAPTMAQSLPATSSVVLQWNGSDVDEDITGFDLYFGTENPPAIMVTDILVNQSTVSVTAGTIYYWSIVTRDAAGNSSESGVYQFVVLD
ncbi:hypothetical protein [Winogradskyella aurantia]|uniref:Fibronectin type-III domain-containing protein n=1 Tax=Winogradskyella aurantia TaxID=1915063 RepID=A0A265UQG5_9FLAO|nr:hypothetical protein [Winogradskyella aurantia]OZV67539.1 hypothetical protein CA834_11345 [Winogradskyella aurantia]